ncbi:MAG: hypothetical protein ACREHD_24220 [Pirellulales bacterium]
MTSHSIHQAVATNGHRPMSLLLQALKQIESKSPAETAAQPSASGEEQTAVTIPSAAAGDDDASHCVASRQSDEAAIQFPAAIVAGAFESQATAAPRESTIQVIRHYSDGETASEVAVAQSVELPMLAFIASDREPGRNGRRSAGERHRLADELVQLLPDESRAAVAIIAVDGSDVTQLLFDVCAGLAARDAGEVLAIGRKEACPDNDSSKLSFAHAISGRAHWRDLLEPRPYDGFTSLRRGDLNSQEPGFQRRLIRLWEEIGNEFPFVVIDATAGEPDEMVPLVATCDAAFFAVRLHETNRRDAEQLISRIRLSGCHPCGCLVAG